MIPNVLQQANDLAEANSEIEVILARLPSDQQIVVLGLPLRARNYAIVALSGDEPRKGPRARQKATPAPPASGRTKSDQMRNLIKKSPKITLGALALAIYGEDTKRACASARSLRCSIERRDRPETKEPAASRSATGQSARQQLRAWCDAHSADEFAVSEVYPAISDVSESAVRGALIHLKKTGVVEPIKKGHYKIIRRGKQ